MLRFWSDFFPCSETKVYNLSFMYGIPFFCSDTKAVVLPPFLICFSQVCLLKAIVLALFFV